MVAPRYSAGDMVFCRGHIYNDDGVPDVEAGALVARAGARGVVVRAGAARSRQNARIYLVKFERPDKTLGPVIACLEDELTGDPSDCLPGSG
jgi:nitrogen fixation protein NifZ